MKTVTLITLLVTIGLIAGLSFAARPSNQDQRSELIQQLFSNDPGRRSEAFFKLQAIGAIKSDDPELRKILIDLLDKENQIIDATLRESNEQTGVSAKYGEGYSEYVGFLAGAVLDQADLSDKRTLSILLHAPYHPTSRFARKLLNEGDAVISILAEICDHDLSVKRSEAILTLEVLATEHRNRVSDNGMKLIRQAFNRRLSDKSEFIRQIANRSLKKIRP